jgi:hypothetical protein
MRRRRPRGHDLTAEELVAVDEQARAEYANAPLKVRNQGVSEALAAYGFTSLDSIRARYWIRRGKPPDYQWYMPSTVQRKRRR